MLVFQFGMWVLVLVEVIFEEVESYQLSNFYVFQVLVCQFFLFDGFDFLVVGSGMGNWEVQVKYLGVFVFGELCGLICLDVIFDSGVLISKDNLVNGILKVDVDGEMFMVYVFFKVQGVLLVGYLKKNMKFELFVDVVYIENVSLKIGDVVLKDKWIFKVNWIDLIYLCNVFCYNLWQKVMVICSGWLCWDIDNSYVGKLGVSVIDIGVIGCLKGYVCVLYINGEFYGIGDFFYNLLCKDYNIVKNSLE